MKISETGRIIIIAIFVDDIMSAYAKQDEKEWQKYKAKFTEQYKMKDLGDAEWILGIRITRNRKEKWIIMDQGVYTNGLVKQFNLKDSRSVVTPEEMYKLSEADCPRTESERKKMEEIPYRSLVGGLLYASISTRPDIAHAVNMVCRYMENPGQAH